MFKKFSFVTLLVWLLGWFIAYFFVLPPINPQALSFWLFFGPAVLIPLLIIIQTLSLKRGLNKGRAFWPIIAVVLAAVVFFGGMVIASPVFSSASFAGRITINTSSFEEDIKPVDFDNLPLLDKASAQKVGDRVIGQIPELVSQFNVSDEYSLINYKGQIVRVTPLEHIDLYKYMANKDGTAGYVIVDCTTGEAELVKTESGLKYLESSYFFKNLRRHVQIHNPFSILGSSSFELDESGVPYWIFQTIKYSWVNIKPQVSGIIVCNAITGELSRYKVGEIPAWIDNVFDAKLVTEEINSWGLYQGGYINSQFSQKNVVQCTDGYTYITNNDDVYMYTGITSVASDESNIGFVMVNLRTHEAKYYAVPGAEEYSAMDSAKGAVQEKNYSSTFPLLINLGGKPTYLLSLKDSAALVKMYAFVDVQDYQKVSVSDSSKGIKYAADQYLKMLRGEGTEDPSTPDPTVPGNVVLKEDVITVLSKVEATVDNTSVLYIMSTYNQKFEVSFTVNRSVVPFLKEGDTVKVTYYDDQNGLNIITKIEMVTAEQQLDPADENAENQSNYQET